MTGIRRGHRAVRRFALLLALLLLLLASCQAPAGTHDPRGTSIPKPLLSETRFYTDPRQRCGRLVAHSSSIGSRDGCRPRRIAGHVVGHPIAGPNDQVTAEARRYGKAAAANHTKPVILAESDSAGSCAPEARHRWFDALARGIAGVPALIVVRGGRDCPNIRAALLADGVRTLRSPPPSCCSTPLAQLRRTRSPCSAPPTSATPSASPSTSAATHQTARSRPPPQPSAPASGLRPAATTCCSSSTPAATAAPRKAAAIPPAPESARTAPSAPTQVRRRTCGSPLRACPTAPAVSQRKPHRHVRPESRPRPDDANAKLRPKQAPSLTRRRGRPSHYLQRDPPVDERLSTRRSGWEKHPRGDLHTTHTSAVACLRDGRRGRKARRKPTTGTAALSPWIPRTTANDSNRGRRSRLTSSRSSHGCMRTSNSPCSRSTGS